MSEWNKVSLDKLGTISRGKSKHRPRNDPQLYGGDYPFIQTADVTLFCFLVYMYLILEKRLRNRFRNQFL